MNTLGTIISLVASVTAIMVAMWRFSVALTASLTAQINTVNVRVDHLETSLEKTRTDLTERIDSVRSDLTERIDGQVGSLRTGLTERIDSIRTDLTERFDDRIDSLRTDLVARIDQQTILIEQQTARIDQQSVRVEILDDRVYNLTLYVGDLRNDLTGRKHPHSRLSAEQSGAASRAA